jgi:hypothetical protein
MITIKVKRFGIEEIQLSVHDVVEFDLSGKRGDKVRVSIREGQLYINADDVITITPSASNCVSVGLK